MIQFWWRSRSPSGYRDCFPDSSVLESGINRLRCAMLQCTACTSRHRCSNYGATAPAHDRQRDWYPDTDKACLGGVMHRPVLLCTAVERRSLVSELSLSCTRPLADGWPLMWEAICYVSANQANSAFHPFGVGKWVVKLQLDVCCRSCGGAIWWTLTKERQTWCCLQVKLCDPCLSALRVCVHTKMALYKYSSFLFPFSSPNVF